MTAPFQSRDEIVWPKGTRRNERQAVHAEGLGPILRQADGGRSILEVCREANISEVTFHRWKNQFGQMELSEAKRLKELERTRS